MPETTETHRILRRGIPFGAPYAPGPGDDGNRGLMFLCYQTSIVEQFEFIQKHWANDPDFKDLPVAGTRLSGHDLIIGQTNSGPGRVRHCSLLIDGRRVEVSAPADWVIPTGGGYFFAPSISALHRLARG